MTVLHTWLIQSRLRAEEKYGRRFTKELAERLWAECEEKLAKAGVYIFSIYI